MLTKIEVLDGDTGKTTLRLNLRSLFSPAYYAYKETPLADDTTLTLGRVMAYADHICNSLEWQDTDGGYRTTVTYGRYRVWFYSDQKPTNTQE